MLSVREAQRYRCISFGLILHVFLLFPWLASGQKNTVEQSLLLELDSLYNALYTFNYAKFESEHGWYGAFQDIINKLAQEAEAIQSEEAYFKARNILYFFYRYQSSDPYLPLSILDETIKKARIMGLPHYEADFLYKKGTQFARYAQYDSALANYEHSLTIAEVHNDFATRASTINAIAVLYSKLLNYPKALQYYKEALEIYKGSNADSTQMATILGNIAYAYGRMGMGDSAYYYAKLEHKIAKQNALPGEMRQSLNALVLASFLKQDFEESIAYADTLNVLTEGTSSKGYMKDAYLYSSKSWYAMGNVQRAYEEVNKAIAMAKAQNDIRRHIYGLEWLIEMEKKQLEYKSALELMSAYASLKDELNSSENDKKIDLLILNHRLKNRDSEIKALSQIQELDEQKLYFKNIVIVLACTVFVFSLMAIAFFYKRRIDRQKVLTQRAESRMLLAQLNPHFMFNALSSIQLFMINKGQGKEALEYLSRFTLLMRQILEASRKTYITLEDEVSTLECYLNLQRVRFDHRFNYQLDFDIQDETSEIMIPPMFSQPFIENALEHGVSKMENGLISIRFTQNRDTLTILIEDNGQGIQSKSKLDIIRSHQPQATAITKERIAIIKKLLRKKIGFDIKNKLGSKGEILGTRVIIELPIMYMNL